MSRRRRNSQPRAPRKGGEVGTPLLLGGALVFLTLACYWPLVRFYFAQDDFILIENASRGIGPAMGNFFEARPGQFRPLTKGLYFLLTWPLLGLNAAAFHVLSILLHAGNALLVAVLLRRMGITNAVRWFVAALFALNVGYLETVAWVSCVQQLLGSAFMLLALIFGIDALEGRGGRARVRSTTALVLALASYEQVLATPLLLLGWHATRHGVRATVAAARTRLWEQGVVLLIYLVFTLGVRGVPDSGPYVMSLGTHVLDNLRTYSALLYELWLVFPAFGLPGAFTVSHIVLAAIVAFLLYRRRFARVAFGLGTVLALLAPVLFVKEHTHSFHVYVPALGAWFLVALAADEVLVRAPARAARTLLAAATVLVFVMSARAVRANATAIVSEEIPVPRSFVLRRAVLAERMRDDILVRSQLRGRPGRMILLYLYPEFRANWLNIHAALGQGSAVRLFLESPDLDVVFVPPADPPPADDPATEVMVYTELGRCYTFAEVEEAERRREELRRSESGAAADTSTAVTPPREQ